MAKIGLNNFWYSPLNEASDGTVTYTGATKLSKAVAATVTPNNNSAQLYGDDYLAESDTQVGSGKINLTVTDDDETVFAELLGHTVDSSGAIIKKTTDVAPYVGCGRIIKKIVNNVYSYKVEFLHKVKFYEPTAEDQTQGASVEFRTPSIEGDFMALQDATWQTTKTFTTQSDALTYLQSLMASPSL